jgi:hexosaminidase
MVTMRNLALIALLLPPLAVPAIAQHPASRVIPSVEQITPQGGAWRIADTLVVVATDPLSRVEALRFAATVRREGGRVVRVAATAEPGALTLERGDGAVADESYVLAIATEGARLAAPSVQGIRYGLQTMRQILPDGRGGSLAAATVTDAPRYPWRGAMLDVGRHTFPVTDILRWIDLLERYKLNVFHWHLTEDQGWRIAIETYPKLTTVGGFRQEADGTRYGGFFTKAEVRQVVAYAAARGITVVPEIEMPGHARAAIAAYPELSCTGAVLPVPATWGVFADVLCPTESTFRFLEGVLTEVLDLFPSRYIHIGGDEVPKDRWRDCAECQAIIRRENLKDEHDLQRWFTARIAAWLAERGRVLIGWDEIMDGGLPAGAMVQAWQGSDRIVAALTAGADVVASPSEWVYLNRPANELPLARVLQFDPAANLPATAARGMLVGGEAPLWTEHVTSPANAELMLLPRLLGFAETMWRGPTTLAAFQPRLDGGEQARLARAGYAVGPADRDLMGVAFSYDSVAKGLRISTVAVDGVTLSLRASGANAGVPVTAATLLRGNGEWSLEGRYRGQLMRETRRLTLVSHKAVGKPVRLATEPDAKYPGTGPYTLTDGVHGTAFADGFWNGWLGTAADATIDLGAPIRVDSVVVSLLEEVRSWILLPREIQLSASEDGVEWVDGGVRSVQQEVTPDGRSRPRITMPLPPGTRARYIRVVAMNGGRLPRWHPGAGEASWVFLDEIEVH